MINMEKKRGKIIRDPHINVWPHEMRTAEALADAGYTVEFVKRSEEFRQTSADIMMNGELWEIKAPKSEKASAVDKNLRKALHQSKFVVFDSQRMGRLPDATVEHELHKSAVVLRSMRRLLFVNRKREVIDIK